MSFRNESRDTKELLEEILRRLDDLERERDTTCDCSCCDEPEIIASAGVIDLQSFFGSYAYRFPLFAYSTEPLVTAAPRSSGVGPDGHNGLFVAFNVAPTSYTTAMTGTWTTVFDNAPIGSSRAGLYYQVKPVVAGSATRDSINLTYPTTILNSFAAHREFFAIRAVESVAWQRGGTTFPTVDAPGPDWHVEYIALTETTVTSGGPINVPSGTYLLDPAITNTTSSTDGGLHATGQIHGAGDAIYGHEITTAAGITTPRSIQINGPNYILVTMLLDTRLNDEA